MVWTTFTGIKPTSKINISEIIALIQYHFKLDITDSPLGTAFEYLEQLERIIKKQNGVDPDKKELTQDELIESLKTGKLNPADMMYQIKNAQSKRKSLAGDALQVEKQKVEDLWLRKQTVKMDRLK